MESYLVVGRDGIEYGPVAFAKLQAWVRDGRIDRDSIITIISTNQKVRADDLGGLFETKTAESIGFSMGRIFHDLEEGILLSKVFAIVMRTTSILYSILILVYAFTITREWWKMSSQNNSDMDMALGLNVLLTFAIAIGIPIINWKRATKVIEAAGKPFPVLEMLSHGFRAAGESLGFIIAIGFMGVGLSAIILSGTREGFGFGIEPMTSWLSYGYRGVGFAYGLGVICFGAIFSCAILAIFYLIAEVLQWMLKIERNTRVQESTQMHS